MKRKLVLGTVLTLFLVAIIAVAAIGPTIATPSPNGSIVIYAYAATVTLQLPQGVPPHPTTLNIDVYHIEKRGDAPLRGPVDVLEIAIWAPAMNTFLPVADISDNTNPAAYALLKQIYLNTPIWTPGLMENFFTVGDKELEVRMCGDVLIANLTKGVHISLPFQFLPAPLNALGDMSFDLPPMALEFRGIGSAYREEVTLGFLPSPPLSGWTITLKSTNKPAWVRTWIQQWTAGTSDPFKFAGTLTLQQTQTWTPPA